MTARINHPLMTIEGGIDAFHAFGALARGQGVPERTIELLQMRASQINGCHHCIGLHCGILRKGGESEERMDAVANWRESGLFNPAERAALALTEEVTRLADRPDAVPDDVWEEAARHYDNGTSSSGRRAGGVCRGLERWSVTGGRRRGAARGSRARPDCFRADLRRPGTRPGCHDAGVRHGSAWAAAVHAPGL